MDIIIGESPRIGPSDQYTRDGEEPFSMEARFLEIKEKKAAGDGEERPRGRVLSLLIPEGQNVPRGVESGEYRIYLRFVRRRPAQY